MLEKTLESPLDCKEIKLVIGRTDGEAEAPIFDHLMQKVDSLGNTLMLGKIKGKRRRRWQRMRWLDKITNSMDKFEQTLGDSGGQRSLACYHPWGLKESDTT